MTFGTWEEVAAVNLAIAGHPVCAGIQPLHAKLVSVSGCPTTILELLHPSRRNDLFADIAKRILAF